MKTNLKGGIVITAGCINDCPFCDLPKKFRPTKTELRKQEVGIYKDLLRFKKKGYDKIDISGSDPIEYDKIIPLINYMKNIGFNEIHLSTHGRKLKDKEFVKKIVDAGLDIIRIPLYGSNAKIHNSIMQSENSFHDTITAIKNIRQIAPSLKLDINTLVMQENKEDLLNILKLALGFEPREFSISIMYLKDAKNYPHYVPIKELSKYVDKVYNYIIENNLNIIFFDMPYCVFGNYDKRIIMPRPPDLGKYNQPGNIFKSHIKNLPTYRLKTKVNICKECILSDKCDGFLTNDIQKFGIGQLKPIKEIPR